MEKIKFSEVYVLAPRKCMCHDNNGKLYADHSTRVQIPKSQYEEMVKLGAKHETLHNVVCSTENSFMADITQYIVQHTIYCSNMHYTHRD